MNGLELVLLLLAVSAGLRILARRLAVPYAAVLVVGGLVLAFGYQARMAAALLAAFTVVATLLFHAFWAAPTDQAVLQTIMFLKNVAIFGGLLHVFAHGTGRLKLG